MVVTFNPVTPETQIRTLFGSFGAIAELRNEIDPTNGSLLGICSIKYRDSNPIRGTSILAANAAKRAVKEGHGERIGQNQIRVELDREGRKSRRYIDNVLKRTRARLEKERVHNALKPHVEPAQAHLPAPTPTNDTPAPPANAPKGPSAKSNRPADGVLQDAIEKEPILGKIKRKPYVFLKAASVKASTTTLPHLKKKLRACDWREVRVDSTGYYIIFEDSKRGEDETLRCFETFNGDKLFTYEMELECQQYGNPNYERSPSPETQVAVNRKRAEEERLRLEELEDLEEEKRQRAADLDPVIGALQQVRADLLQMVMNDIKSRVAIPTFYDQLDPSQHAAKRQELDLPDPSENEKSIPAMMLNKAGETPPGTPRARQGQRTSKPLRPHDPIAQRGRLVSTNAYIDERRAKRPAPRNLHRPLAFQFQQASGGDEDDSDDEQNTPATRDTPDQDSRPPSRASRTSTPFGDSEPVDAPRHKRRKLEHKGNMHTEGAWDGDDEPEVFDSFHKQMLGDILQKEPEIMATRELELVVNTLPRTSKFQQRARTELFLRQRNRYDDDLFRPTSDETSESTPIPTVEVTAESGATDAASSVSKKSKKKPRKTKKQIFEEREALKAATKAVADSEVLEEDAMDQIEEKEAELDAAEEVSEEPTNPEVDWSVSADKPRRTVEDDPNLVMDIDGWQHIIKDEEDLKFARMALEKFEEWDIGDPEKWAATQKEIKFLNTGIRGPTTVECKIQGYYKPNPSGCARLEPYKKILESEKSKYLPHRLKVQKAREEREAQAKENPNAAATAEAAKQAAAAKTASTTSSRSNRANNRRLVNDIKLQKSSLGTSGAETDTMRFNQLKKRKKNVKFDRSAIHGWGLYAMENIAYNDLIIEYVGELVRQKVADLREQQYEKQGVGSSYLFRMADDEIVDATKKGGIARFINHSCSPNCTARIIKVEGTRRIVIYALKDIAKGKLEPILLNTTMSILLTD